MGWVRSGTPQPFVRKIDAAEKVTVGSKVLQVVQDLERAAQGVRGSMRLIPFEVEVKEKSTHRFRRHGAVGAQRLPGRIDGARRILAKGTKQLRSAGEQLVPARMIGDGPRERRCMGFSVPPFDALL